MAIRIELPQVGESVTEGIVGRWLKQPGDVVEKYEPLVEVVTDKVNMEVPSPYSGKLTTLLVNEGDTVPMGTAIAEMETGDAEERPEPRATPPETPTQPQEPAGQRRRSIDRTGVLLKDVRPVGPTGSGEEPQLPEEYAPTYGQEPSTPESGPTRQASAAPQGRKRYSPIVRKLAREHGIDPANVPGTGMGGRVTRDDVLRFVEKAGVAPVREPEAPPAGAPQEPPAAPARVEPGEAGADEEVVALTPLRRMIAGNMVRSATQIPQAWSYHEVDVSGLVARRESLKEEFSRREGVDLTYLPFVIKAVAESLRENPMLNSAWAEDRIILKRRINIGVAVAAPQGLVVPVIHDADRLSTAGLAHACHDLVQRARQNTLTLQDVQGGTFTVNNTGALGSIVSQPLVNPPQAAILTAEAIVKRPVVLTGDAIAVRPIMNVCMSFDHRIVDGAESGAFMLAVKRRLEAIGPDTPV